MTQFDNPAPVGPFDWFNLAKYHGLASAPLELWAQLIADRLTLNGFIKSNAPSGRADIEQWLHSLEEDPLKPLGFGRGHVGTGHRSDTESVRFISVGQVRAMSIEAGNLCLPDSAPFSVAMRERLPASIANHAQLHVDLNGTDDQLRSDFARWLKSCRQTTGRVTQGDYEKKVKSWAENGAVGLPLIDLKLVEDFYGIDPSLDRYYRLLFPTLQLDEAEGKLRTARDHRAIIFTWETQQVLQKLAIEKDAASRKDNKNAKRRAAQDDPRDFEPPATQGPEEDFV